MNDRKSGKWNIVIGIDDGDGNYFVSPLTSIKYKSLEQACNALDNKNQWNDKNIPYAMLVVDDDFNVDGEIFKDGKVKFVSDHLYSDITIYNDLSVYSPNVDRYAIDRAADKLADHLNDYFCDFDTYEYDDLFSDMAEGRHEILLDLKYGTQSDINSVIKALECVPEGYETKETEQLLVEVQRYAFHRKLNNDFLPVIPRRETAKELASQNFGIKKILNDIDNAEKKIGSRYYYKSNDIQIDIKSDWIESGWENFRGTVEVSENGKFLISEDSRCVGDYHLEVVQRGQFDDLSDVKKYLNEKYSGREFNLVKTSFIERQKIEKRLSFHERLDQAHKKAQKYNKSLSHNKEKSLDKDGR